ncbi:hypothetical protein G7Y79_00037g073630 [Physcia stellaris]|nr:hypothetical protein G7Y79_00037g073630 [Physcia stellaris]
MNSNNSGPSLFAPGWVDQPAGRGTLDVIWSCFFTIFVATWTVLHLNVPALEERSWQIQLRKAKWMVAAIIVPEVVTASAFAQRVAARSSVRAMKNLGYHWTMQHAFYLNMGAVWLQPKDSKAFPLNATQLQHIVATGYMDLPTITEEEIWDKSKADKFAKIFACGQIGWLVLQCMGRKIQNLPITALEIATLGFAIPSVATLLLWFYKPADIEVPSFIRLNESTAELLERISPVAYSWRQTPLDFIDTVNSPSFTSEIILKTSLWPARSIFVGPSTRIRNDVFALKYSKLDQLFMFLVWTGYAGVHLSAWNFSFPTHTELLLWRAASAAMAGSMLVFWITSNRKFYLLFSYLWPRKREKMEQISAERKKVSNIQILLGTVTTLVYMAARMCLIVQVFLSLRRLPIGAYQTVSWSDVLPHI